MRSHAIYSHVGKMPINISVLAAADGLISLCELKYQHVIRSCHLAYVYHKFLRAIIYIRIDEKCIIPYQGSFALLIGLTLSTSVHLRYHLHLTLQLIIKN